MPPYTTLNPGDVYALGLVSYMVSGNAAGGSVDTIGFVAAKTLLTDDGLNPIASTTMGGSITIDPASVPEPSALVLGMIAIAIGATVLRRRRGRTARRRTR
jgi:hypothetical protein